MSNERFLYELSRTHHNAQLRATDNGKSVVLMGWVATRRDHGGVIFVDLRDLEGLTQVVFDPTICPDSHKMAEHLRSEFCIAVQGKVRPRPDGMINNKLPTGEIEVAVERLEIFSKSETPPFEIETDLDINEIVRLEYRYLDLRKKKNQQAIVTRSKLTQCLRNYLNEKNFFDIETPFLTKSTPEGARDYLVPARNFPGHAFALPQSPQLFKQLLMVSGFERYYQIARCFRDEDLRADRQPDFTQIDLEMSFINEDQIFELIEGMLKKVWNEILGEDLKIPFERMPYSEAMENYGSDKPDLRLEWKLKTVTEIFQKSDFKVFRDVAAAKNKIQCLRIPDGSRLTRKDLDELTPFGKQYGAKGIAWIKINQLDDFEAGWQSPISKFLSKEEKLALASACSAQNGDVLIFCADKAKVVADALGNIRLSLGRKLKALKEKEWRFLWVIDFPLFQWDEDGKRWVSEHHPFTSPKVTRMEDFDKDPGNVLSNSYDIVLNGMELGSGSIRIHRADVQERVFKLLKLDEDSIQEKFGFLIKALSFGAPPHGGIALGLDRLAMILAGATSLREVIAFPKTQRGQCLLTKAPSMIAKEQWDELHLKVVRTEL